MICINLFMRMIDFDFNFVEYGFGSNKEPTCGRIGSPYDRRRTIHLKTESARSYEPIQNGKITGQDRIFWMFDVCVFHIDIIRAFWGVWSALCASYESVLIHNHKAFI